MFAISMFTASEDIERALGLLLATVEEAPRHTVRALPLAEARERLVSRAGYDRLCSTASGLGVDADRLMSRAELTQVIDDELLSRRALKLHRGRNVYAAFKARLWRELWLPFREVLLPADRTMAAIDALMAMDTQPSGRDAGLAVHWIVSRLEAARFSVSVHRGDGCRPLIEANRAAEGGGHGRVVLYGHYDVEAADRADWTSDPLVTTEREGRLHGVGIGDNKAALALRLLALEEERPCPELRWLIQGEEETDSPLARRLMPAMLAEESADLFMEETGYFELNGAQRVLAGVHSGGGELAEPDDVLSAMMGSLDPACAAWGISRATQVRRLNKSFFPGGCPFGRNLPLGARYLAIGINDPRSGIHAPNESVPAWTLALHERQFINVLQGVAADAGFGGAR